MVTRPPPSSSASENVVWHGGELSSSARASALGQRGFVFWLTGLSGSGKSTLARRCERYLVERGTFAVTLDGDNLRHGLCGDLGFSDADRIENMRRITEVARVMADSNLVVLVAFISPFAAARDAAKKVVGADRFAEVHVATPLSECEARDGKGLYAKARAGEIKNMTGIDSPFEVPVHPELMVSASSMDELDRAARDMVAHLDARQEVASRA